ncbi:hypothetical protein ymoll0001_12080 [Yersinia mollaretii ATCC 43969]|uniref:Uncharacterized protein n=1 Tax=Yersinia mollaretii (strain ATCC 43969 / DSM 18520 / CIP 103324 / CNY 7263 / WAIP 204) TaxID=349967 RepID=A0ABM9YEU4_YERMW|nr:hypothetical protein ymoll0001_12080 [Yersinia mollaretii ATCC 43969]
MDTATGSLAELVKDTAGKQIIIANNSATLPIIIPTYIYRCH